jgi:hypothetical protein
MAPLSENEEGIDIVTGSGDESVKVRYHRSSSCNCESFLRYGRAKRKAHNCCTHFRLITAPFSHSQPRMIQCMLAARTGTSKCWTLELRP